MNNNNSSTFVAVKFTCALYIAILLSCGRPPIEVPKESDVVYNGERRFEFNSTQRQFSASFEGKRSFTFTNEGCRAVTFAFDNNSPAGFHDTAMLSIYDESGLLPGEDFRYTLTKISGGAVTNWPITLSNPISASGRKRAFMFKIALNPLPGEIDWGSSASIAGQYLFGTTDRTMTVELTFDVKSRVPGQLEGSCGPAL